MAICRNNFKIGTSFRAQLTMAAALALVAAALALASLNGHAAGSALSKQDQQCLGCHAAEGLETKLANGETLSLRVDAAAYGKSVHSVIGCSVCHAEVTLENHPPLKKKIASVRENSLALTKVCGTCHADKFKLYEGGIHAVLLREGNPIAPVCTDCHSAHAVMAKAAFDTATGTPCSKCHGSIYEAYAASVHGQALKAGRTDAPVCSTCHSAHDVKATAAEDRVKDACLGCHPATLTAHQAWLPNAQLHLNTVSCPACHAPGARRKVDLRLYDSTAQQRITQKEGVPQFETRARAVDTEGKGLNDIALQSLLREFSSSNGTEGRPIVRGRLEVESGEEAHQLADKTKAVRQCESCHRAGSAPFEKVTISIAGPDGRPLHYGAQHEVLNSAISVDSIGGFYVIGGTRIKLLDMLVLLALIGGVSVPVLHLTFGWLSRKYAKKIGGRDDS